MNNIKKFKITNVNLRKFELLLNEALKVNNIVILEFDHNFIKNVSISTNKNLIKLFSVDINKISHEKKDDDKPVNILDLGQVQPTESNNNIDCKFDFYFMRGEIFKNNFGVFDKMTKPVELTFECIEDVETGRTRARNLTISGTSKFGSAIEVNIQLTDNDDFNESVNEYGDLLARATPAEDSYIFNIEPKVFSEVTELIKELNKNISNTLYINITIDKNHLTINNKIFRVEYTLDKPIDNPDGSPVNIKVSNEDWNKLTGSEAISVHVDKDPINNKLIFITKYLDAIYWSMMMKVIDNSDVMSTDDESDEAILESLDVSGYDF